MLLTDKEMKSLRPDIPICSADPEGEMIDCGECSGQCRQIAKAQLKKMVEWGGEECFEHRMGMDKLRRRCSECWQSLLKEVGL